MFFIFHEGGEFVRTYWIRANPNSLSLLNLGGPDSRNSVNSVHA